MQVVPAQEICSSKSALLPYLRAAHSHVGQILRCAGTAPVPTARAAVSYDLSMLALGHHAKLSLHAAAMTASHLLYLAAEMSRLGGGPAKEPATVSTSRIAAQLERDAAILGDQTRLLTQEELSDALGRFRAAMGMQGLDLAYALAIELAEAKARTRHYAAEAMPPAFMLPRGPATARPRA
jgi:hypothetical protein